MWRLIHTSCWLSRHAILPLSSLTTWHYSRQASGVILKPSLTPLFPHTHVTGRLMTANRLALCPSPTSLASVRTSGESVDVSTSGWLSGQACLSDQCSPSGVQDTLLLWENLHWWDHAATRNETQGISGWLSQTESPEFRSCWSCLDRLLSHQMGGNHHSR